MIFTGDMHKNNNFLKIQKNGERCLSILAAAGDIIIKIKAISVFTKKVNYEIFFTAALIVVLKCKYTMLHYSSL